MRRVTLALVALAGIPCLGGNAWAGLEFNQMEIAIGLAQVIANADPCGYKIDQAALERYFVKVGLSTPEGLEYVSVNVPRQAKEVPTQTKCTLSKSTAKTIGILGGD